MIRFFGDGRLYLCKQGRKLNRQSRAAKRAFEKLGYPFGFLGQPQIGLYKRNTFRQKKREPRRSRAQKRNRLPSALDSRHDEYAYQVESRNGKNRKQQSDGRKYAFAPAPFPLLFRSITMKKTTAAILILSCAFASASASGDLYKADNARLEMQKAKKTEELFRALKKETNPRLKEGLIYSLGTCNTREALPLSKKPLSPKRTARPPQF